MYRKIIFIIVFVSVFVAGVIMDRKAEEKEPYQSITFAEALSIKDDIDYSRILDVRSFEEFDEYWIEGSLNIPLDNLEQSVSSLIPDKEAPLIVICRSGNRSLEAIDVLRKLGYTDLYDAGGIPLDGERVKTNSHS